LCGDRVTGSRDLLREFDGPLLEYSDGLTIIGGSISGNKQNGFTGDVFTPAAAGNRRLNLMGTNVVRVDGDVIDGDGLHHSAFHSVEFDDVTRHPLRLYSTTTSEASSVYVTGSSRFNNTGSILLNGANGHDFGFNGIHENGRGPGIEVSGWDRGIRTGANALITNNDGPGIFVETGSIVNAVTVGGTLIDNVKNPTKPDATRIGEITAEGAGTGISRLRLEGLFKQPNSGQEDDFIVFDNNDTYHAVDMADFGLFSNVTDLLNGGGSKTDMISTSRQAGAGVVSNATGLDFNAEAEDIKRFSDGTVIAQ